MYNHYTPYSIKSIPSKNEGYVYLVEAQGMSRYKIGRSVNPIARFDLLKKQSPYPLKIIDCFWTPDCIADEKFLHEQMASYRVHGEWFEFDGLFKEKSTINLVRLSRESFGINGSITLIKLAKSSATYIRYTSLAYAKHEDVFPMVEMIEVYSRLNTLAHLHKAHNFIFEYLPTQIHHIWQVERESPECKFSYNNYVSGAIDSFVFMMSQESQS